MVCATYRFKHSFSICISITCTSQNVNVLPSHNPRGASRGKPSCSYNSLQKPFCCRFYKQSGDVSVHPSFAAFSVSQWSVWPGHESAEYRDAVRIIPLILWHIVLCWEETQTKVSQAEVRTEVWVSSESSLTCQKKDILAAFLCERNLLCCDRSERRKPEPHDCTAKIKNVWSSCV